MKNLSNFLFALLSVWLAIVVGIVILPSRQIARLAPVLVEENGVLSQVWPIGVVGLSARGKEVFLSEGCQSCHTQVIRGVGSADVRRGWGSRKLVPKDFIGEERVSLGWYRLGPDFSNLAVQDWRNEPTDDIYRPDRSDIAWLYGCLLAPGLSNKGTAETVMPSYKHLFKQVAPSDASELSVRIEKMLKNGIFFEPSPDAVALITYLRSLKKDFPLREAGPSPGKVAGR